MRIADIRGVYERRGGGRRPGARSGGAGPLTPLQTLERAAGAVAFFDFDYGYELENDGDSDNVAELTSRIGGHVVAQAAAAQQPPWGAQSPTGRRGATFTATATQRLVGTTDALANALEGNTPFSYLWVARFASFTAARVVWGIGDSASSNNCLYDQALATSALDSHARGDSTAVTGASGSAHSTSIVVKTGVYNGSTYSSWLNGALSINGAAHPRTVAADIFVIGCRRLAGAYNAGMEGVIWMLLPALGVWTTAQRQSYEAAALKHWVTG